MNKEDLWRAQLNEAIQAVQEDHDKQTDYDRGAYSAASMVAVKFYRIQERDRRLKQEGIPRGSK